MPLRRGVFAAERLPSPSSGQRSEHDGVRVDRRGPSAGRDLGLTGKASERSGYPTVVGARSPGSERILVTTGFRIIAAQIGRPGGNAHHPEQRHAPCQSSDTQCFELIAKLSVEPGGVQLRAIDSGCSGCSMRGTPRDASRSAPTRPAQVAAPPRSMFSSASQDRSPHGRAGEARPDCRGRAR